MPPVALSERLLEPLLLRRAIQRQRSYTEAQRAVVSRYARAARLWREAAGELSDIIHAGPALLLLEQASLLAVRALLKAQQADVDVDQLSATEAVEALKRLQSNGTPPPPMPISTLGELLRPRPPEALAEDPGEGASDRARQLRNLIDWCLRQVEPRTLTQMLVQRALRVGIVFALLAGALYVVFIAVFAPDNLALAKPVAMSSLYPGSPPASGLVNGSIESTYGAATERQRDPWLQIDLLAPYAIERVKVTNRGDQNSDNYLPLVLELSEDGKTWQAAARRSKPFAQGSPWVYRGGDNPKRARYVRLRTEGVGLIALSEVEINGKP